MAQGSAYPAEIVDANGNVTEGVTLQFTDDTNQPGASGSIGPVVVSGSASAGKIIVATAADAADWQTPAPGSNGELLGQLLNGIGQSVQYAPLSAVHGSALTLTTAPIVIAAMGDIATGVVVAPLDVPDISDAIDCAATLFVTNLAGTNTLTVSGTSSQATPVVGTGTPIDWTGTSATIVGADLSWDGATSTVSSTAGGIFVVMLVASCGPD